MVALNISILSLGSRKDAAQFKSQAATHLSGSALSDVRKQEPTVAEIKAFFKTSPEWVYIGGHFRTDFSKFKGDNNSYINVLHNEQNNDNTDATIKVEFLDDHVAVNHKGTKFELKKDTDFLLHKNLKAVLWGGCNVHSDSTTWSDLNKLFGSQIVSVGWVGKTGWELPHIVMGGTVPGPVHDKPKKDFFELVKATSRKPSEVKDAWLTAAAPLNWTGLESHFNVRYHEAGKLQEWGIKAKKVVKLN